MVKATIAIIGGISIIILNQTASDPAIIKGTTIDFGYFFIGYGVLAFIWNLSKKYNDTIHAGSSSDNSPDKK